MIIIIIPRMFRETLLSLKKDIKDYTAFQVDKFSIDTCISSKFTESDSTSKAPGNNTFISA